MEKSRKLKGRAVRRSWPDADAKSGWREEWLVALSGSVSDHLWSGDKSQRDASLSRSLAHSLKEGARLASGGRAFVSVFRVYARERP